MAAREARWYNCTSMPSGVFRRAACALLLSAWAAASARPTAGPVALVPNRRISASLTAARQCYPVTLPAGLVSRINLDQAFGDLVSDVYSPSGALVLHLDSFEFGIETATLTPAVSGRFRACVSAAATTVEPTRYTLWLDAPRAPLPEDELRAKAYRAASDAKRLAASGVSADLRRAIETDRKALELFESLGDASAQARKDRN